MWVRLALDQLTCISRCGSSNAASRASIAFWPASMLGAARKLCEAIALTVASVFLDAMMQLTKDQLLQFVAASRSFGLDTGLNKAKPRH